MDQNNDDKGIDLSHALDDSSSRVKFEGEEFQRPRSFQTPTPKIVQWVIKYSGGAIKDERRANYVLIGFVVLVIIISLFLFFGGGNNNNKSHWSNPDPAKRFNINTQSD